jgi:VCBS repeat-containing protein
MPLRSPASDADDDALSFTAVDPPHGSLNTLTPSANCAALNTCTAQVTYTPDANYNGGDSFTFKVNDGTINSSDGTVTITVNAANDAPALDSSKTPVLADEDQDDPAPVGAVGTAVSNLVDLSPPSGGVDNVSDVDSGAVAGMAITATAGAGTWWYSINTGRFWTWFAAPPSAAARLVAASGGRIYYQPASSVSGTLSPAITFRAWDTTSGSNGGTANTSPNGGTTAFSSVTDTANLTVNATAAGLAVDLDPDNSSGSQPNWAGTFNTATPATWAASADTDATATSPSTDEITEMDIVVTGVVDQNGTPGVDYSGEYLSLCGIPLALTPDTPPGLPGDNGYFTDCPAASPDHSYFVGITGTVGGTLTVSIFPNSTADTDDDWSDLLQEMQYFDNDSTPTTGTRVFTIAVTNGTDTSNSVTSTITVS